MSTVSLVKPTIGTVHVSLFGTAKGDVQSALTSAGHCLSLRRHPGARLVVTAVTEEPAYRSLAAGVRYTITGYAR